MRVPQLTIAASLASTRDVPRQHGQWIVCQLGARENYAVGRALAGSGRLAALITDAWHTPGSLAARFSDRLRDRFHPELAAERIEAPGYVHIASECRERCFGPGGWRSINNRNIRFEDMAARRLRALARAGVSCSTVFAYSYAAGAIFRVARELGLRTVLGQIDPGPVEDEIVGDLYRKAGQSSRWERIPQDYWARWREEVELSDTIVANSRWSKALLVRGGVPIEKIVVVPLAYDRITSTVQANRAPLPVGWTAERPLRMLFLGQVTLRKGIGPLLSAIARMPSAPLRLDIVGPLQIELPDVSRNDPRIRVHGSVPRSAVHQHYEQADLFVFPTISDGFGLTQLEALAHGLPVLTSSACGEVIEHDVNGFVLEGVTAEAIERILRELLEEPGRLQAWTDRAAIPRGFSKADLAENLFRIGGSK